MQSWLRVLPESSERGRCEGGERGPRGSSSAVHTVVLVKTADKKVPLTLPKDPLANCLAHTTIAKESEARLHLATLGFKSHKNKHLLKSS